jgi:hypothetical protein
MIVNLADKRRLRIGNEVRLRNAPPTGITLVTKKFYGPGTDQKTF